MAAFEVLFSIEKAAISIEIRSKRRVVDHSKIYYRLALGLDASDDVLNNSSF